MRSKRLVASPARTLWKVSNMSKVGALALPLFRLGLLDRLQRAPDCVDLAWKEVFVDYPSNPRPSAAPPISGRLFITTKPARSK